MVPGIIVGGISEAAANHYHSLRLINLQTANAIVTVAFVVEMALIIWFRSEKNHKSNP